MQTLQWDFDNNFATVEATGATVTHQFDTSGTKTVRFRTVDNCGQTSNVDSESVVVTNGAPVVGSLWSHAAGRSQGQAVADGNGDRPRWRRRALRGDLDGDGDYLDAGDQSGATLTQIQTSFTTSGNHKVNLRGGDTPPPCDRRSSPPDVWVNFPPQADTVPSIRRRR